MIRKLLKNQKGSIGIALLVIGAHVWLGAWIIHWAKKDYEQAQKYQECQEMIRRIDPNGQSTKR